MSDKDRITEKQIVALAAELGCNIVPFTEIIGREIISFDKAKEDIPDGYYIVIAEYHDYPLEEPLSLGGWNIFRQDFSEEEPNIIRIVNDYMLLGCGSYVTFAVTKNGGEFELDVNRGGGVKSIFGEKLIKVFQSTKRISELLGVQMIDPDRPLDL